MDEANDDSNVKQDYDFSEVTAAKLSEMQKLKHLNKHEEMKDCGQIPFQQGWRLQTQIDTIKVRLVVRGF